MDQQPEEGEGDGPETAAMSPVDATLEQMDRLAPYILLVYRSEGRRSDWTPSGATGRR